METLSIPDADSRSAGVLFAGAGFTPKRPSVPK